jgi:hypothetical protein
MNRLTLNLGVRYEFITVHKENHGRVSNLKGDLAFIYRATIRDLTVGNPWYENPSRKNFAPRVGFAWDVFGDGKTAVRGGGGFFFQQMDQVSFRTTAWRSPPFVVDINQTSNIIFPNQYTICASQNPLHPETITIPNSLCDPVQPQPPAGDSPRHRGHGGLCRIARRQAACRSQHQWPETGGGQWAAGFPGQRYRQAESKLLDYKLPASDR